MPDGSPYPASVRAALRRGGELTRRLNRAQAQVVETSAERRALIDTLRDLGVQYADIAEAFGVTESAVRKRR